MNTKKVVFAKLFSKEAAKAQKLSKQRKVSLSVVSTAQTEYSALEDLEGDLFNASEMLTEFYDKYQEATLLLDSIVMDTSLSSLNDTISILQDALSQIEDSSATLGVEPDEVFEDYDKARELIESVKSSYSDFMNDWTRADVQNNTAYGDRLKYLD